MSEEQRPKEEAGMHLHNHQSVRIGTYATPHGLRALNAVRVDGEITVFDMLAEPECGDHDQRIVEEGLVTPAEIHALAGEYLRRATHLRRPLVRAA